MLESIFAKESSQIRARTWAPKQPHHRNNAAQPPKRASDSERAIKKQGSRGQSPRRSFLRLSPEKAGLPPGVGREPTLQGPPCGGPERPTKTPPAWHQAGGCHIVSMEPGPPARVCLSHKHSLYQDHVENRPPCNAQEDVVLPLMQHPHKEDA